MPVRIAILAVLAHMVASCASGDFEPNLPSGSNSETNGNSGESFPNNSPHDSPRRNSNPADCSSPPCDDSTNGATNDGTCVDADGDGYGPGCAAGPDCDDGDASVFAGAPEICDGQDNDCDGEVDEGLDCSQCIDADGDGHGVGCPAGPDCDDSDPERFDGAPEACDGKDNDCDGRTDEDFDLGVPCSAGLGVCAADGVTVCTADGTGIECDAPVGTPQAEVCDRLDNDCDGQVDEGLNCPACIEDANEPDDSSTTGTPLPVGASIDGQLCPGNVDWFRLGTYSVGQTVSVTAEFSHAFGDIDMEMYVGATYETGSYSGTDNETINRTLSKSGSVTVRLYYAGNTSPADEGTSYTVRR